MTHLGITLLSVLFQASLASYMSQIATYATRLHIFQAFIDDVITAVCRPLTSDISFLGSQTFQAYAHSLSGILNEFRKFVSQIEKRAIEQGELILSLGVPLLFGNTEYIFVSLTSVAMFLLHLCYHLWRRSSCILCNLSLWDFMCVQCCIAQTWYPLL